MKMNGTIIAAVIGFALTAAMPLVAHSQSATRGVYVGVGAGEAWAINYPDLTCTPQVTDNCKKTSTVFRFFGGWQFGRNWALEFAFSDLGKVTASTPGVFDQSVKARVSEMTIVGSWPTSERTSLYAKAGAYYGSSSAETTQNGVTTRFTEARSNATVAAGLQVFVTPHWALRAEGQHYYKVGTAIGDINYTVYTAGALFKFQ